MRLAILGLGLIGGSLARALRVRAAGRWSVTAWSPTGNGPATALSAGAIDFAAGSPAEAISGADLVVLAAPPLECLRLVDDLAGSLRTSLGGATVITDVASTKRAIVARAAAGGLRFVGGHPMAGRETTGFESADPDLFVDRPWIICPVDGPSTAVDLVDELARAVGARPLVMDAAIHDAAVAATSHLPLIAAAALAEAVLGRPAGPGGRDARRAADIRAAASRLAASGWRDMTRLALGDPAMGAGIAATNPDFLAERVRHLRDALDAWLEELDAPGGPNPERLEARLAAARELLRAQAGEGSDAR